MGIVEICKCVKYGFFEIWKFWRFIKREILVQQFTHLFLILTILNSVPTALTSFTRG